MKFTSTKYMAQNECEISRNFNKIDDDDGSSRVQFNWCLRTESVSGVERWTSEKENGQLLEDEINRLWKGKRKVPTNH